MGSENFNRQFILLDFTDLDNPDFLSFTRSPEFSTYLIMRRHIWRSRDPHYMGLHEYFAKGYLACSLDREKIAEWLSLSLVSVSNDITALTRRTVIESLRTGRQNIFVLGRWVEDEGAYFEHFHLDRLYIRSKENLISGLLDGRNKENFTSDDNLSRSSDVKKVLRNNKEENREPNREENREMSFENSNIRKASNHDVNVITDYVSDLARELNDEASLPSSVSRAMNLYRRADGDLDGFIDALLGARAATKQHSASIRKQSDANGNLIGPTKNRMAYFFAVLEDVLGLGEQKVAVEVGNR
ncbi:MAG: hypothetical protein M3Z35_04215 [Nitrospirota bacterium]|nr:hypothetical protein [Nitrospirota bacterium]